MYILTGLTNDPKQITDATLFNGKVANLYFEYYPQQYGWFLTLTYGDFTVSKVRVVNSPNFFRQFRNLIPFGVACFVEGGQEPMLQDDFVSGRAKFYFLDTTEVDEWETTLGE